MKPLAGDDFQCSIDAAASSSIARPPQPDHRLLLVGVLLLTVGLALVALYWFFYDVTVTEIVGLGTPEEKRVVSLDRMSTRSAGMIGGGVLSLLGALGCLYWRIESLAAALRRSSERHRPIHGARVRRPFFGAVGRFATIPARSSPKRRLHAGRRRR